MAPRTTAGLSGSPSDLASSRTRSPWAPRASASASRGSPGGSRTSGAPSSQVLWVPSGARSRVALYLRAEENGSAPVQRQPSGPGAACGQAAVMARRLALGRGSAAPRAASTRVVRAWSAPSRGISRLTSMPPSVSVPVLSRHTVSTRASPSIAGSSCTRHRLRPSRMTPTAKATEVSSTRPSGTIGTIPPTIRRTASRQSCRWRYSWLTTRPTATGTIIQVTYLRIRLMPERSSEWTRVKRLASSASRAA